MAINRMRERPCAVCLATFRGAMALAQENRGVPPNTARDDMPSCAKCGREGERKRRMTEKSRATQERGLKVEDNYFSKHT